MLLFIFIFQNLISNGHLSSLYKCISKYTIISLVFIKKQINKPILQTNFNYSETDEEEEVMILFYFFVNYYFCNF